MNNPKHLLSRYTVRNMKRTEKKKEREKELKVCDEERL